MDIEVISFYLNHADEDGSFFSGTLHIRLLGAYDLDIRGIIVIMKDENWNFFMPNKIVDVDGKKVRYPIVSFSDREKTKDLLRIVIEKGKEFVSKKIQ